MDKALLLIIAVLLCARLAAAEEAVFDKDLREGWSAGAWGGDSRAEMVTDQADPGRKCIRIELTGGATYTGAFLMTEGCLDLSPETGIRFLTFRVKGAKGGEEFSVALRDGTEAEGRDGFAATVEGSDYVTVGTEWRQVDIPLADFPRAGFNWTLPPYDQLPHVRPVDWSRINMIGFNRTAQAATFCLDRIAFTSHLPDEGKPALIEPLAAADSVDFSRGETLEIGARFSALSDWAMEIRQGAAAKRLNGTSYMVMESWDGGADDGVFGPGPAEIVLRYRTTGSKDAWAEARRSVRIEGTHAARVQVNQVGYLPGRAAVAYLTGAEDACAFTVVEAGGDGKVLTGRCTAPVFYELAGEKVARLDLSGLDRAGLYRVEVEGVGSSFPFAVGSDVYDSLFLQAMKSYYYQRCGTDLEETYAGQWTHGACHTGDAYVYEGYSDGIVKGEHVPSTGGWHDAGDYGKKIVPAASCLSHLLRLAELFPDRIRNVQLNVPGDGAALPDYLREVKHELEWFLTMQREDGAVHHLVTSEDFFTHDMPEKDPQPRYLVPVSSCATADFAAVMAAAYRAYRPFDPSYAAACLSAAHRAWRYLAGHPDIFPPGGYTDPEGTHGTGAYADGDDRDERFWAACELYASTREGEFLEYVRANLGNWQPLFNGAPVWMDVHLYGVHSLLLADGVDEELAALLRKEAIAHADKMVGVVRDSPYGMAIDAEKYWWNNATILEYGAQFLVAHMLTGDDRYADAALLQLGYVLGCNPMDYCYVSGFGTRYPRDIWHGASANDGIDEPIPGFVVPGPCLVAWDPTMSAYRSKNNLPVMKTYRDLREAYSVNEVCLPFNAPLVFMTGFFALR